MKRELKEKRTKWVFLSAGGNSSIPYEEGTESQPRPPDRPPEGRVTAAFPMKRELKDVTTSDCPGSGAGNSSIPYEEGTERKSRWPSSNPWKG